MYKRFAELILISITLLFSNSLIAAATSPTLCNTKTDINVTKGEVSPIIYDTDNIAAIIRDGCYVGYLKINSIQKMGIWDWFNTNSMSNDVRNSYAINVSVNLEKLSKETSNILIKPTISFVSADGEILGKSTSLGWSGFSKNIILYGADDAEVVFELVVQPTTAVISENTKIVISFEETGHSIEDVCFNAKELQDLQEVIAIKSATEPTQITSVNGGQYTFSVDSVTISDNKFLPVEEGNPKYKQLVYDVKMRIRYDKAPDDKNIYTKFNEDDTMSTSLFFGIQSDIDASILYESNDELLEKKALYAEDARGESYFRKYFFEEYTNLVKELKVGEMIEITFNRVIVDSSKAAINNVRVIMEFPEEIKNNSAANSFDGRYIIYEVPVQREEELDIDG